MKKGNIYRARIIRTDYPNKGIGELVTDEADMQTDTDNAVSGLSESDKVITCVIKDALPEQTVEFRLVKKRAGKAEGRLLNIIHKAPYETDSPCPHFKSCGGCAYLNIPYEKSLEIKEAQIKRLLDNALMTQEEPWSFDGIKPSPVCFGYRNKMEYTFGDAYKGGPLALGMHKRGSFYDIETVSGCRIADEDYGRVLSLTLEYFDGVPFYHRINHTGYLRHLLVRKGARTGELLVALVTTSKEPQELADKGKSMDEWKDNILNLELINSKITGVIHIINDSVADAVKADEIRVLYGRDYIYDELLGMRFKISVFSFFQTNTLGAELLYRTVGEYINGASDNGKAKENAVIEGKTVFDLYSGTGTIAQMLSPYAKKVIGVEIVPEAVCAARENAALNGLSNCEFIEGDVLKVLDDIEEKPDFIVLDPPRDGVNPKALKKITDYGVNNLIYISCKPTSLARDLEFLLSSGYILRRAVACDQFPWTNHCEVCCLLKRLRNAKDHISLTLDMEDYYRIKDMEEDKENDSIN